MQATDLAAAAAPAAPVETGLPADLFALVSYLHKSCTSDLFEAVGAEELSLTQVKLLHHLEASAQELTLKQAAEAVRVSLPAASRMVDDLVCRGFVERHEDVDDRRMKRISITDAGGEVIRRLNAARFSAIEQFVDSLSAGERQSLAQVLTRLLARPQIAAARPRVRDVA